MTIALLGNATFALDRRELERMGLQPLDRSEVARRADALIAEMDEGMRARASKPARAAEPGDHGWAAVFDMVNTEARRPAGRRRT